MEISAIIAAYDNQHPDVELSDKFVYHACIAIKGRKMTTRTWQEWKRRVGVRKYNRTLSLGQAIVLAAIAYDRYDAVDNCPLPSGADIWNILYSRIPRSSMLNGDMFRDYVEGRVEFWCTTKELPTRLEKLGAIACSRASVYKKIGHLIEGKRFHYKEDIDHYLTFFENSNARQAVPC